MCDPQADPAPKLPLQFPRLVLLRVSTRVSTSEKKGSWLVGQLPPASREVRQSSASLGPPSTCLPSPPLPIESPSPHLGFYYNQNIVSLASNSFIFDKNFLIDIFTLGVQVGQGLQSSCGVLQPQCKTETPAGGIISEDSTGVDFCLFEN